MNLHHDPRLGGIYHRGRLLGHLYYCCYLVPGVGIACCWAWYPVNASRAVELEAGSVEEAVGMLAGWMGGT